MQRTLTLIAAVVLSLAPAIAVATPQDSQPPQSGNISPAQDTGQPDQSCEDLGNQPGQAIDASGSAFNPDGTAGDGVRGESGWDKR
jgi:hypothetical protein